MILIRMQLEDYCQLNFSKSFWKPWKREIGLGFSQFFAVLPTVIGKNWKYCLFLVFNLRSPQFRGWCYQHLYHGRLPWRTIHQVWFTSDLLLQSQPFFTSWFTQPNVYRISDCDKVCKFRIGYTEIQCLVEWVENTYWM